MTPLHRPFALAAAIACLVAAPPLHAKTRPTLVVGTGEHLVLVDANTGAELSRVTPVPGKGLRWSSFVRRGQYLLAEGTTKGNPADAPLRGLALVDGQGRVLWAQAHLMGKRVSRRVFLNEQGYVTCDTAGGGLVIAPTGALVEETPAVPAGPILGGALPYVGVGETEVHWLDKSIGAKGWSNGALMTDEPPRLPRSATTIIPLDGRDRVSRVRAVVYPGPHFGTWFVPLETLASVPLPPGCAGDDQNSLELTMSPRHAWLNCSARNGARAHVLDLETGRFFRPADITDTIGPDGEQLALVGDCNVSLRSSPDGKRWRDLADFEFGFHPNLPGLVCGRLVIDRGAPPSNLGCIIPNPPRVPIVSYAAQPDGRWQPLAYRVYGPDAACSADGNRLIMPMKNAAVPDTWELTIPRLDRDERRSIGGTFPGQPPAVAWLPER